jgi:sugar lactone lactonase YvrE
MCSNEVLRLPAGELGTSGLKHADARLTVAFPEGLAFDRHGNLWVNNYTGLSRFDAARLGAIDPDPPDLKLSIVNPTSLGQLRPTGMAFDAAGNLWSLDYPAERLFRLKAADLAGTGVRTVEAAVAFRVTPSAISGVPAFDESGGLWLTQSGSAAGSQLVRISPEQLAMNGDQGLLQPEVQITSRSVGSAQMSSLAFFPAPQGLPLSHSLPAP